MLDAKKSRLFSTRVSLMDVPVHTPISPDRTRSAAGDEYCSAACEDLHREYHSAL